MHGALEGYVGCVIRGLGISYGPAGVCLGALSAVKQPERVICQTNVNFPGQECFWWMTIGWCGST
jgi:hypothetical protein